MSRPSLARLADRVGWTLPLIAVCGLLWSEHYQAAVERHALRAELAAHRRAFAAFEVRIEAKVDAIGSGEPGEPAGDPAGDGVGSGSGSGSGVPPSPGTPDAAGGGDRP